MRAPATVLVVLLACGCGDDDVAGTSDAHAGVDGSTTADAAASHDAGSPPDAGGMTDVGPRVDTGPRGGTMPPVIRSVSWVHGSPCTNRDRMVTITTTVEDPDTAPGSLRFSGEVYGCTGALDAAMSAVTCRGTSTTIAYVRVTDEGGRFDEEGVNIHYCEDGSATF